MKIHIDFETRSEVDIWKSGAWAYSAHPSTSVLCMAYAIGENPVQVILRPKEMPEDLLKNIGETFTAHNSFFEQSIWKNVLGWTKVRWECTMAKACTYGLPKSLAKIPPALGLDVRKDESGRRIMLRMSKPRTPTKNNSDTWYESDEDFKLLAEYCKQDVEVERAIDNHLEDLSPLEYKVWQLDQTINFRGVQVDIDLVDRAIQLIQQNEEFQKTELYAVSGEELTDPRKVRQTLLYLQDGGLEIDNLQKETIEQALKIEELPDDIRRVLEIRQELSMSSTAKFKAIKNSAIDSRIRDLFVYHSASTGRWGGKLVQLQNLPRGTVEITEEHIHDIKTLNFNDFNLKYNSISRVLSSAVRGCFIAKPKHKLLVVDYASIESRVVLWLARDKESLGKYDEGCDFYLDMAEKIFNKPVTKEDKFERSVGKVAILGCAYGMGVEKFQNTCAGYGIEISVQLAQKTVHTYRATYKDIVTFWRNQEEAFRSAILKEELIPTFNHVDWGRDGDFILCQLPSGRFLRYHHANLKDGSIYYKTLNSFTKQYAETKTWGGKIVENITQAVARDVMAYAMLRLEDAGYPIVMTIHDELVCEVPDTKEYSLEKMIKIMVDLPQWAKGLPLHAEGWEGYRYRK